MQSDPLDATRWALEYLTLDGVSHMVSGRRVPEIAFLDGRVSADDGVNFAEGTCELEKDSFSASVSSTTSLSYPQEALPEHDLFEHLSSAHAAVLHGDFLHLRFGEGDNELVYHYEEEGAPA